MFLSEMAEEMKDSLVMSEDMSILDMSNNSSLWMPKMERDKDNEGFCQSSKIESTDLYGYGDDEDSMSFVPVRMNGIEYKVPWTVRCHLCSDMMRLNLRKTKYLGESREYVAYRCNHKGCQTFRSVKKVFGMDSNGPESEPFQYNEQNNEKVSVRTVNIPNESQCSMHLPSKLNKPLTEKCGGFKVFHDKLKDQIMANKELASTARRSPFLKPELVTQSKQGTLLYISRTLTSREILDVQDAILNVLTKNRGGLMKELKELPIFSPCPFTHEYVQQEIYNPQKMEELVEAINQSPQPPLPSNYYVKRDDNCRLGFKRNLYSDCSDAAFGMTRVGKIDDLDDPVTKKEATTSIIYGGDDEPCSSRVDRKALSAEYMRKRANEINKFVGEEHGEEEDGLTLLRCPTKREDLD